MKLIRLSHLAAFAGLAVAAVTFTARAALPLAGTPIGNQAKATYTDDSAVTREVFSNTVITTITQVAGLTLVTDLQSKIANPGSLVYFPHTVTNTGNGTDSFTLTKAQLTASPDTFNLDSTSFAIYPDANQDGLPDNYTAITTTGSLEPGAEFHVVLVGLVPAAQAVGGIANVSITATSVLTPAQTVTNTDTVTVVNGPVLQVTKAVTRSSGKPGEAPIVGASDEIKYTITYTNTGNATATNFKITDVVPTGLAYVASSGRWSVTGATVLTDADKTDAQSGIIYDYGITTAGTVTAVIASVPAGGSGYITINVGVENATWFKTTASGGNSYTALPKVLNNTASYTFTETTGTYNTNIVPFTVQQEAGATFVGDNEPSNNATPPVELGTPGDPTTYTAPAGSTVVFRNVLTNTGTGIDTFDITVASSTFPAGTSFQLFQGDAQTPLVDSNGNSTPDTGPLAPNATYTVVLKAILPTTASGTAGYSVVKTATSSFAPTTVKPTATDSIKAISGANVDLTNNTAGVAAPGYGAGPEGSAVITNTTNPATTTIFTLVVANTGPFSDSFSLLASNTTTFGTTTTLPAGWSVVFKKSGVSVSNTGAILPGQNQVITAEVTVPAGISPENWPVYFQVKSPTSNAADILHDAIKVSVVRNLILQTDNVGQTFPGGSLVYVHTLKNNGNVTEGVAADSGIAFALLDSFHGFTSVVYFDTNNDGTLTDGTDLIVTGDLNTVLPAGIPAGQTVRLFVKVTAPLGAADGTSDTTKLTVTTTNATGGVYDTAGVYVSSAPAIVSNVDTTSVTRGDLSITKEQALDVAENSGAGDGNPDGAYVTTQLTAPPGSRIIYRITVTNTGSANATAIAVNDTIPANTTYSAIASTPSTAKVTGGTTPLATGPTDNAFVFSVGTLAPSESAVITFGVKIDK